MLLSVIIPVYNEKKTILMVIDRIQKVNINKELIIVDDGSDDGTREILKSVDESNTKVIYLPINMGKGAAIRFGLEHVQGDIVIIQDADLEYDPDDYHKLIKPIISEKAQVVYGKRDFKMNKIKYLRYYWGGQIITILANFLYGASISDEPTCYKMFRREVFKKIKLRCIGFEFCPEVTVKVRKMGLKIYEVPISYYPRSIEDGKKIHWIDGLKAIYVLFKYKFTD